MVFFVVLGWQEFGVLGLARLFYSSSFSYTRVALKKDHGTWSLG